MKEIEPQENETRPDIRHHHPRKSEVLVVSLLCPLDTARTSTQIS